MSDSRPPGLFWALACIVAGLVPMLSALDVIPTHESSFHAPRWVVFIAGSLFFMVGMWLAMQALVGESRAQALGPAIGFAITLGLAYVANWVAFGAGAREGCTGGFSFFAFESSRAAAELECRIAFGYGAMLINLILLRALAWWLARPFPANRGVRALEKASEWGILILLLPLVLVALLLKGIQDGTTSMWNRLRGKDAMTKSGEKR